MIITPLAQAERRGRRVALGEFDGVHIGHRAVIAGNDTVVTFEPHPRVVLTPHQAPKLLTPLDLKAELVESLGVAELVVIPFTESFANQLAEDFVTDVLVGRLGVRQVSIGANLRFGYQARGNAQLLAGDSRFDTRVVPLVPVDGSTVSSTRIRELLAKGDVAAARQLLGAPFRLRGEVVPGDQRGRELGFPTANIVPAPELCCPANGVYACRVGGHIAAVNVGVRPTFGEGLRLLVEPFLIDFSGDLYGKTLTVEFIERLRGEARFDSASELIAQMESDVVATRQLLA